MLLLRIKRVEILEARRVLQNKVDSCRAWTPSQYSAIFSLAGHQRGYDFSNIERTCLQENHVPWPVVRSFTDISFNQSLKHLRWLLAIKVNKIKGNFNPYFSKSNLQLST